MNCATHPDREEVAACSLCGKTLCQDCLLYANDAACCESCAEVLQRRHAEATSRGPRTLFAVLSGVAFSGAAVAAWEWNMFRTQFGLAMFTSQVMLGIALAAVVLMRRVAGRGGMLLRLLACGLVIGILLRGEHLRYQYSLFQIAHQQRLTAEQLLHYSEQYTYMTHLKKLGPFDYLFMIAGLFVTWRRLRPSEPVPLEIIKPDHR